MPARVTVSGVGLRKATAGSAIVYRKWVRAPGGLRAGELVEVYSPEGELVACALWEPEGPVALRIVDHGACEYRDPVDYLDHRIMAARRLRERISRLHPGMEDSYRLVNSDGDLLSGLIVDVFAGEVAVVQSSSIAIDAHIEAVAESIARHAGVEAVYEKSTQRSRRDIGLGPRQRWLLGRKPRVVVEEGAARFIVDVVRGQKTGFYLDQRPNRLELARLVSGGERVLDVFSYTGGFGIHAALAGAREVWFLEEDPVAAEILRENLRLNGVRGYRIIRDSIWRAQGVPEDYFDIIVVDPPAFIQSGDPRAVEKGRQAYYHAYKWALERARDEYLAYLSSCSYFLDRDSFLDIVARVHRGVDYRILGSLRGAGPDHVLRGEEYLDYLKGAFIHGRRRPSRVPGGGLPRG